MLSDPAYKHVWENALKVSPMGDMLAQLNNVKYQLLSAHNSKYNYQVAMGVTDTTELKALHKRQLVQVMLTVNRQIVLSIWGWCLDDNNKSPKQDALRGILATKEMKEVSLGENLRSFWQP